MWQPLSLSRVGAAGGRLGGEKSNAVVAGMLGVVWIRSYISHAEGKICCEYEGPDEEAVREHAPRAGLPVDRIWAVSPELDLTIIR